MQTPKFTRVLFGWFVLIGLGVLIVGCGSLPAPFTQPTRPVQPAAPTTVPTPVVTETTAPRATPVIPPTPVVPPPTVPPTIAPTPTTAPLPNLSGLKLATKDLPGGFVDATADNLKRMNLTEDAMNAAFQKIGAQARVQNFAAFQHAQRAQVVANFLIYPLTAAEKTALTTQLASSDSALKAWGSALVGEAGLKNAKPLAGADKFGDKSVGFTTTSPIQGVNIRADAVMIVRGGVIQVVLSFHPDSVPPAISAADLAKLLDTRLTTTLAGK
ncbi:MAG: hypothetical protein L0Y55_04970 [Anaerolineales bacterium]|nr:hypothetical protein [Anaerolineales bacterium]